MKLFYRFACCTVRQIVRLLYGIKLVGLENLDFKGPALIACNHISLLDPPLVGSFLPFEIHFMAKSELFKNPLLGAVIGALNAFPVKRGMIDRQALEKAGRLLTGGGRLLVFPEGTRQKGGILAKARPGIAKLALDNKVPVLPICILGANRLRKLMFARECIVIRIGRLMETVDFESALPEKARIYALTERIMLEIRKLQENPSGT